MQDPSHRVAQPLQNHVHLISGHRFPLSAVLNLEQAFRYLIEAPQIVKQLAPMSWTYVQPPQDGTIWLEWLSPNRNDVRFPSDGYVWVDPEQAYRQEYGGYTIELMAHTVGYRPNFDALASHARTRYHLVAKNPSVNAAPPDPMLWIVHYHQNDPNRVLPTAQVPPSPQAQQVLSERRWLESQGRLEKKDFMLHDQEHWPTINVPSGAHLQRQMQQAGFYGAQAMSNATARQQQYPPPGAYPQQPPPKRQRQQGPPPIQGPAESLPDVSIEEEENTMLGDYFDHLTPREISMTRYMQHHRWMEEVFSSPYNSHSIVPVDLGLGLLGELKGLTAGIVEPPSQDFMQLPTGARAQEARPFTNLKKEQLDEFNKRVELHLQAGRAEIERMKADHTAKMQEWRKTKALIQAEKKLRSATWDVNGAAVSIYRLDAPISQESPSKDQVEDVVKATENLLGVKIVAHEEASLVARGGLEDEQDLNIEKLVRDVGQHNGHSTDGSTDAAISSGSAEIKGSSQLAATSQQPPTFTGDQQQNAAGNDPSTTADVNDDVVLDDMDLDIPPPDIDFGTENAQSPAISGVASGVGSASGISGPTQTSSSQAPTQTASTVGATQQPPSTTANAVPPESGDSSADQGMFNDNEFADLANLDDEGDDGGLIDFDGGMGLEDSAFGDALHGMDGQEGSATPHEAPVS